MCVSLHSFFALLVRDADETRYTVPVFVSDGNLLHLQPFSFLPRFLHLFLLCSFFANSF